MDALVSRALMIRLSLQPSPASETSAFNKIRAFSSRCAGLFPFRISASSRSRSSPLSRTTYFFTEISSAAMIASITRVATTANHEILSNWLKRATSPSVAEPFLRAVQPAARALGLQVHVLNAITERDFDTVFATFVQLRAGALVIAPDATFISRSEQLAALTLRHAVPAITQFREFTVAGGLMSYGGSFTEA